MPEPPHHPPTLAELEGVSPFADRHIGLDAADRAAMLRVVGAASLTELADRAVPAAIRRPDALPLPEGRSEAEVLARLRELAGRNEVRTSLIGLGYHATITPAVIRRNLLENPAWYTAYTPYQPEISQGRLEALLNFQTMVGDLTGMEVANASMLDEPTAAAEAMTMARRISGQPASAAFFVHDDVHPHTLAVIRTRAEPLGIELVVGDARELDASGCFGALLPNPTSSGEVVDWTEVITRLHDTGALAVVTADPLSLLLVRSPGSMGADIVVGSAQRFGVPVGFGGPHAAFLATSERHVRSLPGRLVGVSTDSAGRPALRLTLQTREQHIRREKATSNICTAQVLLANIAGFYAVWHGPEGLRAIAERVHRLASVLVAGLRAGGITVVNDTWFDTVTLHVPGRAAEVMAAALERGINLRPMGTDHVGIALDETTTRDHIGALLDALGAPSDVTAVDAVATDGVPADRRRTDAVLTHPVFHRYRTEHELLRYLRRLADADLALDRTMIPLGSCTMKLNAAAEMEAISWPELASIHPFAPLSQAAGYVELIHELEQMLVACTGYDAVSLQPNAGSQGELAGLLAIRAYHRSRGEDGRDICLIPSSAHGTNAASAVMAGLRVVVVACDDRGNVDVGDLRAKVAQHGDTVGALMVTYPSTHGVYEPGIQEVCETVHEAGGQVYVDGANFNALVGIATLPGLGADVSHLNLHKTFCIPHGGGGPGVGPIGVRAHLAPFLPNHPLCPDAGPSTGIGPVSGAPWGSAGILPISWAYVALMGGRGLADATLNAVLSANYLARRLDAAFPVLYTGEHGDVAHECILDLRPITKATGVTAEDVTKRLMDYGFHAPTLAFPVAGTLMVEPTESESKHELDRFCDAMLAIRAEIDRVASGDWPVDQSPLRHAPRTAADVVTSSWDRAYSREEAAFPLPSVAVAKYFPPVGRIDAAYGDRHLVCSCPPIEAYATT
jgi:glycine dehydrogenase